MKTFIYSLPVFLLLLSSCGDSSASSENESNDASESSSLSKVEVTTAISGTFEHFFEVQGTLKAEKNSILTPESGGKITSVLVKEGDYVQQGATIATFDQSVISSNIKELEKNLEMAQYLYEKQKTLFEQGVGSELQLKQAQTQYEALKQTKQTLNTQQGKFVLTAPYSGYVEEVFSVVGEVASPMSPIIRLISLEKVSVVADISEVYLKDLDKTNKVEIYFPAINDTIKNATISRLGKFINPANRTIDVEINIPSKEKYIPNLMAVVKVRDYVDTSAIIIPTSTILEDNKGNSFVFTVNKENKAIKTPVKVASSYNGFSSIKKGLSANEKVVLKGARKLVDQQEVAIEK